MSESRRKLQDTEPTRDDRPTKRPKAEDPILFNRSELWVDHILPFLGPGHYVFVAGVNKQMKQLYTAYFERLKTRPRSGGHADRYWVDASKTSTFYSAAFSSISCAKYWDEFSKNEEGRLRDKMACACASGAGSLDVLKYLKKKIKNG